LETHFIVREQVSRHGRGRANERRLDGDSSRQWCEDFGHQRSQGTNFQEKEMTHTNHENYHHNQTNSSRKNGLHKDWRTWVVVLLMLGAMAIYVLSFDERFQFFGAKPAKPAVNASNSGK
jgi:hypothetical protein